MIETKEGLVVRSTGSFYTVETTDGNLYNCKVKGKFRIKGIRSTNPVAVGDYVTIKLDNTSFENETIGLITAIHERKNYIIRRSQNLSKESHIIATNIDQAVLVITLSHPTTTTTFIDRYLASTEAYKIPTLLIFNKIDLYDEQQLIKLEELIDIYSKIGYQTIQTSAKNTIGLDLLKEHLKDKINVLNGHSGVGKSTLINAIEPGLNLKTSTISDAYNTGKHTTTNTTLIKLSFGGYIIDTPGIKAFGVLDMEPWEISHYFPEIFKLSEYCQYNNCTHTHEPGCAVKEAFVNGEIAESRYTSYLGLLEDDTKYRPPH